MLKLAEPAEPEPEKGEPSRRRGLMLVETAMELAGTGRRAGDAMMQVDSGGDRPQKVAYTNFFDTTWMKGAA